jgi:hypothetical protein
MTIAPKTDDSGSMKTTKDRRMATQEATVRGLFNILKALGSERLFAVMPFEFEDKHYRNLKTPHAVDDALGNISYGSGVKALQPLQCLIEERLEKQAKDQSLPPTVVVVITDGDVRTSQPPIPHQSHRITPQQGSSIFQANSDP